MSRFRSEAFLLSILLTTCNGVPVNIPTTTLEPTRWSTSTATVAATPTEMASATPMVTQTRERVTITPTETPRPPVVLVAVMTSSGIIMSTSLNENRETSYPGIRIPTIYAIGGLTALEQLDMMKYGWLPPSSCEHANAVIIAAGWNDLLQGRGAQEVFDNSKLIFDLAAEQRCNSKGLIILGAPPLPESFSRDSNFIANQQSSNRLAGIYANTRGWLYLDIFKIWGDENGRLLPEYADDKDHANKLAWERFYKFYGKFIIDYASQFPR